MTTNLTQAGKTLTQNAGRLNRAVELTKTDMAAMSGVSIRTLQRIESARKARRTYRPALSTVVKLADFAGVSVDDFIKHKLEFQ
jgi:transcriptional regulator with XRE-family HTH domain